MLLSTTANLLGCLAMQRGSCDSERAVDCLRGPIGAGESGSPKRRAPPPRAPGSCAGAPA